MAIAERVGGVQDRHSVTQEEFRALKPGLVEVVYEWAKGMVRLPDPPTSSRLISVHSRSSKLPSLQTSRKAQLFASSHGLMRLVER